MREPHPGADDPRQRRQTYAELDQPRAAALWRSGRRSAVGVLHKRQRLCACSHGQERRRSAKPLAQRGCSAGAASARLASLLELPVDSVALARRQPCPNSLQKRGCEAAPVASLGP